MKAVSSINLPIKEIHISLLDEGVDVWRPTRAIDLGNGLFRLLATPDYDPSDEKWEFLPDSIVKIEEKILYHGVTLVKRLVAVKA